MANKVDLRWENLFKKGTAEPSTSDSPLGASLAGANPDQAKMAGTPEQAKSAAEKLQQPLQSTEQVGAVQPKGPKQQNYSDYMKGLRPDLFQASAEEEQTTNKLKNEALIGKMRMDAKDMIASAIKPTEEAVGASGEAAKLDVGKFTTDQLLENYNKDPDSIVTSVANMSMTERQQIIDSVAAKAAPDVAAKFKEQLEKTVPKLGDNLTNYAQKANINLEQFAKDMGTSVDALKGMTPEAFSSMLAQKIDEDSRGVREKSNLLNSPVASDAEKAAARRDLIRDGAIGLRTPAEEAADLAKDLNTMNDIQVGGVTYTSLKDLLADNTVTTLITTALNKGLAGSDKAYAECVRLGLEPIMEKYNKTLKELSATAEGELGGQIKLQQDALALASKINIDYMTLSSVIPKDKNGLVDAGELKKLSNVVNSVAWYGPETYTQFANDLKGLVASGQQAAVASILSGSASPQIVAARVASLHNMTVSDKMAKKFSEMMTKDGVIDENDLRELASLNNNMITDADLNVWKAAGYSPQQIADRIKPNLHTMDSFSEYAKSNPEAATLLNFNAVKEVKPTATERNRAKIEVTRKTNSSGYKTAAIEDIGGLGMDRETTTTTINNIGQDNVSNLTKRAFGKAIGTMSDLVKDWSGPRVSSSSVGEEISRLEAGLKKMTQEQADAIQEGVIFNSAYQGRISKKIEDSIARLKEIQKNKQAFESDLAKQSEGISAGLKAMVESLEMQRLKEENPREYERRKMAGKGTAKEALGKMSVELEEASKGKVSSKHAMNKLGIK